MPTFTTAALPISHDILHQEFHHAQPLIPSISREREDTVAREREREWENRVKEIEKRRGNILE